MEGGFQMKLAWEKLIKMEPDLDQVLKQAEAVKDDKSKPSFCASWVWYGYDEKWPGPRGFKGKISHLVGWDSRNDFHRILGSSEAYDLTYEKIYATLPNCRNCFCA
jgi:hypothetical protein